jgi:predicted permease
LIAAVPPLLFGVIAAAPTRDFDWPILGLWLGCTLSLWALAGAAARLIWRRGRREALLLGMCAVFTNHVFFVLPIATALYGPQASPPIAAIIALDSLALFATASILLDVAGAGAQGVGRTLRVVLANPVTLSVLAGLAVNLSGVGLHPGVETFSRFMGAAAAPMMLFALGVTLSGFAVARMDGAALTGAAFKVLLHPLVFAGAALFALAAPDPEWRRLAVMTAAGPCGAMPFALALRYGAPTESLARAIVLSTLISVAALALLA